MDINRFIELLETYLQNRSSEEEQQELFLMIASGKYDAEIQSRIDASFNEEILTNIDPVKAKQIREYIVGISRNVQEEGAKNAAVIPLYKRKMFKYIAAASVVLIASLIVILSLSKNDNGSKSTVATTHDVNAPKETRAVITLANGQKVYLDSVSNGTIAQETNVNVIKKENGEISYNLSANSQQLTANSPSYNTLFNPRGSKVISLALSDGSHVWLNSGSSIKYPVAFIGNERMVEITGEAYFEVKHNTKQPFKVHLPNGSTVEDIGTSFNINAYPDEEATKTTLIEGAVKVSAKLSDLSFSAVKLKPGEQAINHVNQSITRIEVQTINVNEVVAWKGNRFFFDGADIHTIARQLSRWYDVDVEIKDNIPSHFTGIINRDVPVSQVFDMLQKTGAVHFSVEARPDDPVGRGKKIVIKK